MLTAFHALTCQAAKEMRAQQPGLRYAFLAALEDAAAGRQPPILLRPEHTLLVGALNSSQVKVFA